MGHAVVYMRFLYMYYITDQKSSCVNFFWLELYIIQCHVEPDLSEYTLLCSLRHCSPRLSLVEEV